MEICPVDSLDESQLSKSHVAAVTTPAVLELINCSLPFFSYLTQPAVINVLHKLVTLMKIYLFKMMKNNNSDFIIVSQREHVGEKYFVKLHVILWPNLWLTVQSEFQTGPVGITYVSWAFTPP